MVQKTKENKGKRISVEKRSGEYAASVPPSTANHRMGLPSICRRNLVHSDSRLRIRGTTQLAKLAAQNIHPAITIPSAMGRIGTRHSSQVLRSLWTTRLCPGLVYMRVPAPWVHPILTEAPEGVDVASLRVSNPACHTKFR